MNRRIGRLAAVLIVLYVVLFAQLNVIQVAGRDRLENDSRNTRQTVRDFNDPRGDIVTDDGVVIATSTRTGPGDRFEWQRVYPDGDLYSAVTGYYTFGHGATQIERTQNDVLAGRTDRQQVTGLASLFDGGDTTGTVIVGIDSRIQQAAKDALDGREGSVVVIEPSTGTVKAMYSNPTFDPNQVAVHDDEFAGDLLAFLNEVPGDPLLANAYQQRYMPGSTFKVITTAAALDAGVVNLGSVWADESEFVPPQTNDPIQNYGGGTCGGDLVEVFRRSCNTPFARIAIEMGPERMVEAAQRFGIGEPIPFDLPRPAASSFGTVDYFTDNIPLLAIGGFGQGNTQMVPLHMALVAASVANDGVMMRPHVVEATLDHDGNELSRTVATPWRTVMTPLTAGILNGLMVQVVENGTASCCLRLANGVQAAAKTGTAQLNPAGEPERSHAWVIAFAPAESPRYAIAVMLKGTTDEISAGTGGRLAGPIAKRVLDIALAT